MKIEVEYQGVRQTVDTGRLFQLAAAGEIQASTRLWLDDKETFCGNVQGIVFGAPKTRPVPAAPSPQVQVPPTVASSYGPEQNRRVHTPFLDYVIGGGSTPYVVCYLNGGQSIQSSSGGRVWMKGAIDVQTNASGGFLASLGRAFAGETFFMSSYLATGPSEIAFATNLPGMIVPRVLGAGEQLICQRGAYLASSAGVKIEIAFQKKLGSGLFGGEGFIMQRVVGPGVVFLELDGAAYEYILRPGERVVCDTGALAWMDATCSIDVEMVKGMKNMFFGGEGFFNTVITGPGSATFQSMSAESTARKVFPYIRAMLPSK